MKLPFLKTATTRTVFFVIWDILLISFSVWLAFLLRFEGKIPSEQITHLKNLIFLALIFSLPIFYFFKLYFFTWVYVSTEELISLFKATLFSFLLSSVIFLIFRDLPQFSIFPRSTLFISYFLIFFFLGGIRFSKRIYLQIFQKGLKKEEKTRTLIVGAGDAGEQILRSILSSKETPYLPIGFVDDNPIKQGVPIHGIKVLGKINDISRLIKENEIEEMIIALPSASSKIIKKAVELGRKANLKKIKIVPPITEFINGEVSIGKIKEVDIEDLLGREPVSLDTKSIADFIQNKTVLITGAAGSIGSELARQVAKFKPALLLILDQDETGIFNIANELEDKPPHLFIGGGGKFPRLVPLIADICDEEKINRIFEKYRPNVIFHAAAYKHVPLMEEHPDEAVKNNVFGTKIVAEATTKYGVENFVFISTDKSVNPTSVMGATKRVGEMICQSLNQKTSQGSKLPTGQDTTKFISVRFGNVIDSRGSVIPIFREQIKQRGPVEVTHPEMKRYFMTTSEACLLVMQAGAMGQGGEVFVLDMGEPVKILDLAKEMIRLSGFEPDKDIPIVFTGIRPGEKFFEEILSAEEGTIATQHEKIFIAKLFPINENKLNQGLEKLKEAVRNLDKEKIKAVFKELIPSYKP